MDGTKNPTVLFERKRPVGETNPQNGTRKELEKLEKLGETATRELYRVTSFFPLDFFPDTVIIDTTKVSIIHRIFFYSQTITGIFIKDVINVTITSSLLFATVTIQLSPLQVQPLPINYVKKNDALRLRRIIMGLRACLNEKIDLGKLSTTELLPFVEDIGRSRSTQE